MNNNGISRRQFLQWSAMSAGVVALAACAPAGAPAAAPSGEGAAPAAAAGALSYWVDWGNLEPAMAKIVETPELD